MPQCLFSHYFDSKPLQIEDSAARGLGNLLASCNVLSLNWFFRDNYLRPSDCYYREAKEVRRYVFIFRHVLGLSSLSWAPNHKKRKAAWKEKLLLREELRSPEQIFYVKNTHQAPLCFCISHFPTSSYRPSEKGTIICISQWRKLRIIEVK